MLKINSQHSKKAVALGLLFIILSSMMIKAVHYHHSFEKTVVATSTTGYHQYYISNDDYCPICQYVFSPTEAPIIYHFFFIATLLGLQCAIVLLSRTRAVSICHHLRAPPVCLTY